jgi:uncharacterized repeat protein (TIGR03803 family)
MRISALRRYALTLVAGILVACGTLPALRQSGPLLSQLAPASQSYAENVLYSFCTSFALYCGDGAYPSGNLILAGRTIYGTTSQGGMNNYGAVYSLTPSGGSCCESVLHSFAGGPADGANPTGIAMDAGGAIYGTTLSGGNNNCSYYQGQAGCGIVFKLMPSSSGYSERVLYSFCGGGKSPYCADGANPAAGVTLQNGALYGTTEYGGAYGFGTVFSVASSQSGYSESVLYSFKGGKDGANPTGVPIVDAHGVFYGTTSTGGINNCAYIHSARGCGTAFELTPSGSHYKERLLFRFRGRRDGANPTAGLTFGSNGTLFGTATYGGRDRKGVVFSLTPSRNGYAEQVLYTFTGGRDGMYPDAGLVTDKNRNLYGATVEGGYQGRGAVFELTLTDSGYYQNVLYSFRGGCDGRNPIATPIFGKSAAILYGTTVQGGLCGYGKYGYGTVYRLKR